MSFANQGLLAYLSRIRRDQTDGITVNQLGSVERLAHWGLCAGSLVLWLLLNSDWQNALMWAVKAPSPRYWIDGTVRWDKVALCLAWSFSVFLLHVCRYGMAARAIIALLASVLLVQGVDAVLKINMADIPYVYLVVKYVLLAIIWLVAPLLIAAVLAYVTWTKRAFLQTHVRIPSAITLGACAMMVWVGLFDVIYPGIGWR
ncbi:hypothetical protein [Bradyrhizobium sp. CCBAU 051011]|uniref:hypothetical protein n=1 Tax=Bradyrhizobium sp. CCBAU 051011 TaxID=858422 RepID=UPI00137978D1|nr:hypothetical protein [Bradyrhizobium sp. CCBAU 051011]